jgi:hypothetical protein
MVEARTLLRGCTECGARFRIPLPPLRKKVIYLDQSFLSNAFKRKDPRYSKIADRIAGLSHRQLLVCPRSHVHEQECHLWEAENKKELWSFVKRTARGHEFEQAHYIKRVQLHRSFEAFRGQRAITHAIERYDALRREIDDWDNYIYVEVRDFPTDWNTVRNVKQEAGAGLVDRFDYWRTAASTFDEDRVKEADGRARSLVEMYIDSVTLLLSASLTDYLMAAPVDGDLIRSLMSELRDVDGQKKMEICADYLRSEYFRQSPFVDIECQLYALLRARVRMGQFANKFEAKRRISGLFYDVDALSLYGPYCDAVFVDREMERWLSDSRLSVLNRYGFRVFSAANFETFDSYLNEIELGYASDIRDAVEMVEGRQ